MDGFSDGRRWLTGDWCLVSSETCAVLICDNMMFNLREHVFAFLNSNSPILHKPAIYNFRTRSVCNPFYSVCKIQWYHCLSLPRKCFANQHRRIIIITNATSPTRGQNDAKQHNTEQHSDHSNPNRRIQTDRYKSPAPCSRASARVRFESAHSFIIPLRVTRDARTSNAYTVCVLYMGTVSNRINIIEHTGTLSLYSGWCVGFFLVSRHCDQYKISKLMSAVWCCMTFWIWMRAKLHTFAEDE